MLCLYVLSFRKLRVQKKSCSYRYTWSCKINSVGQARIVFHLTEVINKLLNAYIVRSIGVRSLGYFSLTITDGSLSLCIFCLTTV